MAKKFDFKRIGMKVAGVGAGAIVGKIADKPLANMNPKLRSVLKIGIGAILPELAPKSILIDNAGAGLLAIGAADLFDSIVNKPVSGLGGPDELGLGNAEDYIIEESSMSGNDEEVLIGLGDTDNEFTPVE